MGDHTATEEVKRVGVRWCRRASWQIGDGDQREQFLNGRGSRGHQGCPVVQAGHGSRKCEVLALPEPFISEEEEQLVLNDGAAKIHTEIVASERGLDKSLAGRGFSRGGGIRRAQGR